MAKFKGSQYYSNRGIGDAINVTNRLISGQVFWVKKTTDADFADFLVSKRPGSVFNTIQAALNACTSGQQDIVAVCPGTYSEALTMAKDDVTLIGLGATPYATVVSCAAEVCITVTGVDVRIENLKLVTTGDGIVCIYGTGLVGAPYIKNCFITNLTHATATGLINIAGATSRGLVVEYCTFLGTSSTALAVSYAGKGSRVQFNTSEDINTTEATAFAPTTQYGNVAS